MLTFSPGLPNRQTYKIQIGAGVTSIAGQAVELRGLFCDADSTGRVDANDRSAVVAAGTGEGYSIATDVNLSGETDANDRSSVIGESTASSCAP